MSSRFVSKFAKMMWPEMIPAFTMVGSMLWLTGFLLRKMDEFEFDGKVLNFVCSVSCMCFLKKF